VPDPLLTLHDVSVGYAASTEGSAKTVLKDVTLMLRASSRIDVLGVNGAGKSTLIKTLAGELPALAGELKASKGLNIGYFAQQQLDMLRLDETPLQHLARLAPQTREQELRNYLGGFGFSGDTVNSLVGPMSGGEKARLALSLIVWQKPNLLLLDEPSNHLDVDTREALATALAEVEGSVLLVSHDRHLLRTTVDSFWIVADGTVLEFDGDLEDYRAWLNERTAGQREAARNQASAAADAPVDRKAQRRQEAEARQRLSALRKPIEASLKKIEARMERNRKRLDELDALIADPEFYSDSRRDERPAVLAKHGELSKQMEALEEEWLMLQEELEGLV